MESRWSLLFLVLLMGGCMEDTGKEGEVIRIHYENAQIEEGEWVQIDSIRFEHIGKREDAKEVRFPLPSNDVFVDSVEGREFSRDYNPKTIPLYIAKHLDRINDDIPESEKYKIENYALLSYRGVLEVQKADSSRIKVRASDTYDPKIEAKSIN